MKVVKRKLVAVRLDTRLHDAALELAQSETASGRTLRLTDIYEAALRAYLSAAGVKIQEVKSG